MGWLDSIKTSLNTLVEVPATAPHDSDKDEFGGDVFELPKISPKDKRISKVRNDSGQAYACTLLIGLLVCAAHHSGAKASDWATAWGSLRFCAR